MTQEPVRSHRNKIVVEAARLHRARIRSERAQTLVEGPNLLNEALSGEVRIVTLFALQTDESSASLARDVGLRLTLVDDAALRRLADTESPRGPVAVIDIPESTVDRSRGVLVAWGLRDPGNVGTLIRLAAAYSWGFAFTPGTADPWSPKALRAGAGGHFQTSVWAIAGLEDLEGWTTLATTSDGGADPTGAGDGPFAVLIGSEAAGLPALVAKAADQVVTIPTPGPTESLNAASAASILVHELSKHGGQGSQRV